MSVGRGGMFSSTMEWSSELCLLDVVLKTEHGGGEIIGTYTQQIPRAGRPQR